MCELSIGIDIDGTVTEPYYWINRVNEYFHVNIKPENVTAYEIHKILGIDQQEYQNFYHLFGNLLHKEAHIRPDAREVINRLYQNHLIHFVTAREEIMRNVSLDWLMRHDIPMNSISLLGSSDKVGQAQSLKCDVFIEDRYENAVQLAKAGVFVLLIDCNYNQGPLPPLVTRVSDWIQIAKQIENLVCNFDALELAL